MMGSGPASPPSAPVLAIEDLRVAYRHGGSAVTALRGVSLRIHPGEALGLVGESGCGKSTLAFAVMRYLGPSGRVAGGRVLFHGRDLLALPEQAMQAIRGRQIAMVYQDPQSALTPSLTVGQQIAEVFRHHGRLDAPAAWTASERMLARVQMTDAAAVMRRFPHQLSGGMLQRVVIAMALATDPDLLMLDEPTTGLDVTVEAAVLDLVAALRREFRSAIMLVSHNLGVVARVCDRVAVMYAGEVVEQGRIEEVYTTPRHPYTVGLLRSVPRLTAPSAALTHLPRTPNRRVTVRLTPIPGQVPSPMMVPPGCAFTPRCPMARPRCEASHPDLERVSATQSSRCFFWPETGRPGDGISRTPQDAPPVDEEALPPASRKAAVPFLEVRDLRKHYPQGDSSLLRRRSLRAVKAVDGVSFGLAGGETLGIVGESGCGKSTLARCIAGLTEATRGRILFCDHALAGSVSQRTQAVRRQIQMVFQQPDVTLNPAVRVGTALGRAVERLTGLRGRAQRHRVGALLRAVKLDDSYAGRLPRELSGGERQRVAIARALAGEPRLVLCDEPLSALDVSVQAAVLNLLSDLQRAQAISYLFISHDLSVVQYLSDWVAVMYLGRLVEIGPSATMTIPPYHPYTEALLRAVPVADPRRPQPSVTLAGVPPSAIDVPPGCPFHTRCPRKVGEICEQEAPPWRETPGGRRIWCHIPLEDLAKAQHAADVTEEGVG